MIHMNTNRGQWISRTTFLGLVLIMWLLAVPSLYAQDPQAKAETPTGPSPAEAAKAAKPPAPQELFLAINSGDLGYFSALLAAGADPNTRDPNTGRTLLMVVEKAAMAQLLLTHGADPTLQDHQGATALHHMVTSSQALQIIPHLIGKGADVNAKAPGWSEETPFMVAKQLFYQHRSSYGTKVLRLLVQNGADINAADENGYTVLISAVVNDKPELVRLMIELGADINQQANDGLTAMGWAQELGFIDIIELLEIAQP